MTELIRQDMVFTPARHIGMIVDAKPGCLHLREAWPKTLVETSQSATHTIRSWLMADRTAHVEASWDVLIGVNLRPHTSRHKVSQAPYCESIDGCGHEIKSLR